ncbi:MAG: hypothetical protein IK066_03195, partial [Kiritimatiellae bacterium]|nr:hypothetical protein [Kiritimatiellia bacterium]
MKSLPLALLLFSLFTFLFSLSAAPAAEPAAAHSLHLSHDLRSATLTPVAPDAPAAFAVLARRPSLPVTVTWLYDGALPDDFPRNPRTDPAFRRDSSPALSTVVSFDWPAGVPALPGPVRFFDGEADAFLRCLGT